jgi:hypothetical protein
VPGATDTSRAIPARWRRGVEQLRRVHSLLAATLRVARSSKWRPVAPCSLSHLASSRHSSDRARTKLGGLWDGCSGVRWSPSASPRCSHPASRPSVGWRWVCCLQRVGHRHPKRSGRGRRGRWLAPLAGRWDPRDPRRDVDRSVFQSWPDLLRRAITGWPSGKES